MPKELTWRKAIERVLASSASPLHYRDIAEKVIAEGLRTSVGATPASTVNSTITTSIRQQAGDSPFVRVAKATFALARGKSVGRKLKKEKLTPTVEGSEDAEEQYEIVSSFGMFWRRSDVRWGATTKLLGMQQIGASEVDFNRQLGIYLLYDGREVIYIGRTTDRALGRRLYEHTIDRMAARWDRFSWFGLLPVAESGKLGALPATFDAAKLIPALEAILIEALEPRQNRKRGDDLSAVEYIQVVDPSIKKQRVKATLEEALERM